MAPASRRTSRRGSDAPGPEGLRLWAPWRYIYIASASSGRKQKCIFCLGRMTEAARRRNLVLLETPHALVMLNRFPYNNGHVMVAPRRHIATPELLTREERAALGELVTETVRLLRESLSPEGFNVGANLGRVAGAGIADHMHWHVVPRWNGDTNFMPVLASTRVVSQSLNDSYSRLRPVFKTAKADLS
jgi:ATP adenylyltransferase